MNTPRPRPQIGIALRRAHYTFRQALEAELRPLQLSLAMAGVLFVLEERDGVSGAELARGETVTAQTMHQLVGRLVDRGLVERRRHPAHRRILTLHLTAAGRRLIAEAMARAALVEERMLRGFTPGQRSRLLRDLERCVDGLAANGVEGS